MSEIRKTAINSHKYNDLSYVELNKLAKQFDNLTEEELKIGQQYIGKLKNK